MRIRACITRVQKYTVRVYLSKTRCHNCDVRDFKILLSAEVTFTFLILLARLMLIFSSSHPKVGKKRTSARRIWESNQIWRFGANGGHDNSFVAAGAKLCMSQGGQMQLTLDLASCLVGALTVEKLSWFQNPGLLVQGTFNSDCS